MGIPAYPVPESLLILTCICLWPQKCVLVGTRQILNKVLFLEVILGSLAQLADLVDDSVAPVRLKFSGLGIAPAASQAVQAGFQCTVGISPAVADHKGSVALFGFETKLLQSVGDDLSLSDPCRVLAGAIDAVYQWSQSEVVTDRQGLVLGFAGGHSQCQTMLVHTVQLIGNAVKDRGEQSTWDVLSWVFRILECCYLAVIAPVDLNAPIYILLTDAVVAQGYFDSWSDESSKLAFIRHRMTKLFESLHHRSENARMRSSQGTVQIQQNQAAR